MFSSGLTTDFLWWLPLSSRWALPPQGWEDGGVHVDSGHPGSPGYPSIIQHVLPKESHVPPKNRLNGNHLLCICVSFQQKSRQVWKRHVQTLITLGWSLGIESHILKLFNFSGLEFKRETPLWTLVQSPSHHSPPFLFLFSAFIATTASLFPKKPAQTQLPLSTGSLKNSEDTSIQLWRTGSNRIHLPVVCRPKSLLWYHLNLPLGSWGQHQATEKSWEKDFKK